MRGIEANVHAPLKLRLVGEPTDADWQRLEDALTRRYARAFGAGATAAPGAAAPPPESAYGPTGDGRRLLPSYDDGGAPRALELLDAHVARPADPSIVRGVYTEVDGELRLWWWDTVTGGFQSLWLYRESGAERMTMRLESGHYTLAARPRGDARLYQDSRFVTTVRNPSDVDLTVSFYVPQQPGEYATTVTASSGLRFFPRMRVLRIDREQHVATGAQSVFLAEVEIWRREPDGSLNPVYGLALIYAFISYDWEVWRLGKAPRPNAERPRALVHRESTRNAFLRRVWSETGDYEVKCTIALHYDEASARPVTDGVRVDVVPLEFKMATQLALLEKSEGEPGGRRVWAGSTLVLYDQLYAALRRERAAAEPSEARIDYLQEQIDKLNRQVGMAETGPFPLHAIFTEPLASRTMPLHLFVGPAHERDPDRAHTWVLIDLTYPAFYATYVGTGETVREAIVSAFENARSSFRGSYPPGRILARIEFTGMERFDLHAGWEFSIETESWQRTAYEWLSLGAAAIGAVGLAAAIAFPPSAVLTGVLVVGAVAGAAVSGIAIAERIRLNQFEWNTETFVDIAQIAAAFAFGAGAVVRGAAGRVAAALPRGVPVSFEAASKLGRLVSFQRGLLFMGIGSDVASGVLLSVDTYNQLRNVDVALGAETLREYQRVYGTEEGRRRWETERVTRIIGILARAAVGTALTVVSVRSNVRALGASAPRRAGGGDPYAGVPSEEAGLLRQTEGLGRATISTSQVDAELAIVKRTPKRLTGGGDYVEEVELANGHTWRRRPDGTWCRFSRDPFCLLPNATRTTPEGRPLTLRQIAEDAGVRDAIDEGRIAVFLHGTTDDRALELVRDPAAVLSATGGAHAGKFFTATDWGVIDEFAARSVSRAGGGTPAVVGLALSEETLTQLRALRIRDRTGRLVPAVETKPIDDRPGCYETIFHPQVIDELVRDGYFFLVR